MTVERIAGGVARWRCPPASRGRWSCAARAAAASDAGRRASGPAPPSWRSSGSRRGCGRRPVIGTSSLAMSRLHLFELLARGARTRSEFVRSSVRIRTGGCASPGAGSGCCPSGRADARPVGPARWSRPRPGAHLGAVDLRDLLGQGRWRRRAPPLITASSSLYVSTSIDSSIGDQAPDVRGGLGEDHRVGRRVGGHRRVLRDQRLERVRRSTRRRCSCSGNQARDEAVAIGRSAWCSRTVSTLDSLASRIGHDLDRTARGLDRW